MNLFGFLRKKEVVPPTPTPQELEELEFYELPHVTDAQTFRHYEKGPLSPSKECSRCFTRKPLAEFNKQQKSKDGCGAYCKECNKQYVKEYFEKNKLARLVDNLPPALPKVQEIARIQQFLEETEPPIGIQLQDLLDDLDILVGRVAKLQARVNQLENPRQAPVDPA